MKQETIKEKRDRENAEFFELYIKASPDKQRKVRILLGLEAESPAAPAASYSRS